MPTYSFSSASGDTIEVYLDLKQPQEAYHKQTQNGVTYYRVYTIPTMAVNTKVGTSKDDFMRATENKKGMTLGQMNKISEEMSAKRVEKEGVDKVKEKHYDSYEKKMGSKHADVKRREQLAKQDSRLAKAQKSLKKFGVTVDLKAKG